MKSTLHPVPAPSPGYYKRILRDIVSTIAPKWTLTSDGSIDKENLRWQVEKELWAKHPKIADAIRNDAIQAQTREAVEYYIRFTDGTFTIAGKTHKARLLIQVPQDDTREHVAKNTPYMKVSEARKLLRYWESMGETADIYVGWLKDALAEAERRGLKEDDTLETIIKVA